MPVTVRPRRSARRHDSGTAQPRFSTSALPVAAHLPPAAEVRLVDLAVAPLDDATLAWAEVVLIGGMRIQAPSMHAIIARARALGRRTVVGGPAATRSCSR